MLNKLLAFVLIGSSCFADITVEESYKPFDPIVVNCNIDDLPEKSSVLYAWEIPDDVKVIRLNDNSLLHIWAKPGTYNLDCTAVVQFKKDVTVIIPDPNYPTVISKGKLETVTVVEKVEINRFNKTFVYFFIFTVCVKCIASSFILFDRT